MLTHARSRSARTSRSTRRLLESLESRTFLAADFAPPSFLGFAANITITGGTGVYAKSGSALLAAVSSSANRAYLLGTSPGVADQLLSYAYFRDTPVTATLATYSLPYPLPGGTPPHSLSAVTRLFFTSPATGTFVLGGAAGTQTGTFTIAGTGAGPALTAPAGKTLDFCIAAARGAFPAAGRFSALMDNGHCQFASLDTATAGAYSYFQTSHGTAVINLWDPHMGSTNIDLSFSSPSSGTFLIIDPRGAGWQFGTFSARTSPPAAPSNLRATPQSDTAVTLSWTLNSANASALHIKTWTGAAWATLAALPADATSFTHAAIRRGTTCHYEVVAINAGGEAWSPAYASFHCPLPLAPAPVDGFAATPISPSANRLSWQADGTQTGFLLLAWDGKAWKPLASLPASATAYADTSLAPGQTRCYHLLAFNEGGGTWANAYVAATTFPAAAPQPMTGLQFQRTAATVGNISWISPDTQDATIKVMKWTGAAWQTIATLPAAAGLFQDTSVWPGGTFLYQVVRINRFGESWAATPLTALLT